MRRVLLPVLAHVRHVAVDAGDARVRMDARLPNIVVGMLRLEHHRARVGMLPVALEAARQIGALVVLVHLFRRVAVVAREHDAALLRLLEVILRMALAADEGALVVVAELVPCLAPVALQIFDLRRNDETQLHRLDVMACRTGDRSVVRHLIGQLLEALQRIVPAHRVVEDVLRIGTLTGDARA